MQRKAVTQKKIETKKMKIWRKKNFAENVNFLGEKKRFFETG